MRRAPNATTALQRCRRPKMSPGVSVPILQHEAWGKDYLLPSCPLDSISHNLAHVYFKRQLVHWRIDDNSQDNLSTGPRASLSHSDARQSAEVERISRHAVAMRQPAFFRSLCPLIKLKANIRSKPILLASRPLRLFGRKPRSFCTFRRRFTCLAMII